MNVAALETIARAVLYEGYMLYPYRASSVKNRQRFNFGVLYPRAYSERQSGSDAWEMQTECLVEGLADAELEIQVRFLRLVERAATTLNSADAVPGQQEAVECNVDVPRTNLKTLLRGPLKKSFAVPADDETGPDISDCEAGAVHQVVRTQELIQGTVRAFAESIASDLFKVTVQIENSTPTETSDELRSKALMRALISTHIMLGIDGGQFVSLLDPPEHFREAAAHCVNVGTWPVLVGTQGERHTILSSPVILYDYPQIAPESPGDLFDGCEIDEILALRILTMTDDEKREVRGGDERARKLLERTETLTPEQLMKLHGTLRELRLLDKDML